MIIKEKSKQVKEKAEHVAKSMYLSLLREGKSVCLNTSSSSMYPFVKGGDTIKVTPAKEEDIKIGDIIVVDNEEESKAWFYAHRVVRIFKESGTIFFVTKGDASRKGMDEPVGFDRIAGKVTRIERNGLRIDLENPLWKHLNRYIARASLRYPNALRNFAPWISLAIEWRWFFSKLGRRIDEPLCNTEELILICARTYINKGLIKRAKDLICKGIDWEFLRDIAMKSGLSLVFYNALKTIDYPAIVPAELIDKLKIGYLSAVPRINFQYEEAKKILKLLFEKNIPAAPFKGLFLSKHIYGDFAARGPSVDFDLLVEEKNIGPAKKVLEEAGYSFVPEDKSMAWNQQWVFRKPDGILIELHWGIRPEVPSTERMKGFWKGARLKNENSISYYEFNEEELLILLSAHFVGSAHFGQLRYLCDINELLTGYRDRIDWKTIIEESKKYRLSNTVYTAIFITKELFGTHVPDEVLLSLKPGLLKRILIKIAANRNTILKEDSIGKRFMGNFLKYILLQALEVSSFKDFKDLILAPPKSVMGGKSYIRRFKGAVLKLIRGFK